MKIQIRDGQRDLCITLPNWLLFSKATVWIAKSAVRKHAPEAMPDIPPEAMERLLAELKRVKNKYGAWELVEVESAGGEHIRITL